MMPGWFMTLAYICLTVLMFSFLIAISGLFIYVAFISARDWKDNHDLKNLYKQFDRRMKKKEDA